MAREGLMDDTGYRGFDDAEEFAEKYCMRCKNQPFEPDENGIEYVVDCDKDCSLCDPRYFKSIDDEDDE